MCILTYASPVVSKISDFKILNNNACKPVSRQYLMAHVVSKVSDFDKLNNSIC